MAEIRVIIIQPNHLFCDALDFYLRSLEPSLSVVGRATEAWEILDSLHSLHPDIILVDLRIPAREGINEVRLLRRVYPQARVLMTGLTELESDVMACVEAGAAGYLSKKASLAELRQTVEAAAVGEALISPKIAGTLFGRIRDSAYQRERLRALDLVRLTRREQEIISFIRKSFSNKEIAVQLNIEVQTVKNHVHNILEKLQLCGRREVVRYAIENGLIAPTG